MVGIDANLLVRSELQHVLLLLICRLRTTHIRRAWVGRTQDHRLAMMQTVATAILKIGARRFTREFRREELIGCQLTVVVLHGALAHLRRVGRGIRGRRRHIGMFSMIHCIELGREEGVEVVFVAGARLRKVREGGGCKGEAELRRKILQANFLWAGGRWMG